MVPGSMWLRSNSSTKPCDRRAARRYLLFAAKTAIGGTRIIPLQIGEQIPRICWTAEVDSLN
jgi:hypothetical protein